MDQLLKQLAAAAQAHSQPPLHRLPHFDGVHPHPHPQPHPHHPPHPHPHATSALQLYAAAAGWAPFLAMNQLSGSNASDSSYPGCQAATSGSASVHMLRHMALLQRANAAATKLQQLQEQQRADEQQQQQEQELDVEVTAMEPTSRNLMQTEANEGK